MYDKVYKKILIIDGSFLLHRVLSVPEIFSLKNTKGVKTGGVYQFLRSLQREIINDGDYYPIVCFDKGLSKRRTDIDKNYKKYDEHYHTVRVPLTQSEIDEDMDSQYRIQRNMIIECLYYMGIPALMYPDCEGDDLMYVLSCMSQQSLVITDDRDLLQLLSDRCMIRRPKADESWDINRFLKEGLECGEISDISDFVLYKAVIGDSSDNIPSACYGVGKKLFGNFISILKHYQSNDGNFDFTNYPKTEIDMKKLCDSLDIPYRKVYLNFEPDRFNMNIQLVDLRLVDISDDIIISMRSTIANARNGVDYFKLIGVLGNLEIQNIDVDSLVSCTKFRHKNLFINEV